MNCQPIPTDTPGIFRCPECGLQNPRPIKRPFIHQCSTEPPPEPPYDDDTARWIIVNLCGPCPRREQTRCKPDPDKPTKCGNRGRDIRQMLERGIYCPIGKW